MGFGRGTRRLARGRPLLSRSRGPCHRIEDSSSVRGVCSRQGSEAGRGLVSAGCEVGRGV